MCNHETRAVFCQCIHCFLCHQLCACINGTGSLVQNQHGTVFDHGTCYGNMLGGEIGISYEMGAAIACLVFMIYTASSGLFGVVYTDVLQFYMLILFVYILIPVASLLYVGGFSNFSANLDPALVKPYMDGNILGDVVTYLVFTMAGAEMWQRAFSAKDRKAAKKGMFLGTAVYGVTIILVFFMGIVAHQVVGDNILAQYGTTDAVVPALAIKVLPIGLTGLALAGSRHQCLHVGAQGVGRSACGRDGTGTGSDSR